MNILYQSELLDTPLFSLIIISKDDPKLFRCLQSAQEMVHAHCIQLIVVLDASSAIYTERVVDSTQSLSIPTTIARLCSWEPIANVRNRGASLASSQILIYVDSDCTFDPDYIIQARSLFALYDTPLLLSGKVVFCPRSCSWFSRCNSAVREHEYTSVFLHYVRSPNLCIHMQILKAVGGYDPFVPGDDFVLNQKCYLAGYQPISTDALVIYHHDDETLWHTVKTWWSYGIGNAYRFKRECQLFGKEQGQAPVTFSTHKVRGPFLITGFCWLRSTIINAGFLYGLQYWRENQILPLPFHPRSGVGRESNRYHI